MDIATLLVPIVAALATAAVGVILPKIDRKARIALTREALETLNVVSCRDAEITRRADDAKVALAEAIIDDVRMLTRYAVEDSLVMFLRRTLAYRVIFTPDPAGVRSAYDGFAMMFFHYSAMIFVIADVLASLNSWDRLGDWKAHITIGAVVVFAWLFRIKFWNSVRQDRPQVFERSKR